MNGDQVDRIKDWLYNEDVTHLGKTNRDWSGNSWRHVDCADRERLKELEQENRELKRVNEILRSRPWKSIKQQLFWKNYLRKPLSTKTYAPVV